MEDKTTITVSNETWRKLNDLKRTPKEKMDFIINKLIYFYTKYGGVILKENGK